MLVYISGQITGLDIEEAKSNFKQAQNKLHKLGFQTINPFDIIPYHPDTTWEEYMIADIRELFKCDAIYMLHNWEKSKGAKIEKAIAEEMGLLIMCN